MKNNSIKSFDYHERMVFYSTASLPFEIQIRFVYGFRRNREAVMKWNLVLKDVHRGDPEAVFRYGRR
jgi:hypothetical protein